LIYYEFDELEKLKRSVFNFYRKCITNISPTHLVGKATSYKFSEKVRSFLNFRKI